VGIHDLRHRFLADRQSLPGGLENKTANTLAWAPKGRFIALATCGSPVKYDIEFWDVDFTIDDTVNKRDVADPGANMQLLATGEHFGMTDVAWDPSGRYLASSASAFRQSVSAAIYFQPICALLMHLTC
jgi:translation initiation factor 3 subunit B